jgi:hypothetical protein
MPMALPRLASERFEGGTHTHTVSGAAQTLSVGPVSGFPGALITPLTNQDAIPIAKGQIMAPFKHTLVASASALLWWSFATSCQAGDVTATPPASSTQGGWTTTGQPGSGYAWAGGGGYVSVGSTALTV